MSNTRTTQCDRLIDYLQKYGTITQKEASDRLGIERLTSRICELKKRGYTFKTERIKVRNRFGESCYVARYKFDV